MSVLKHHFKKILTAALCLLFIFSLTVPLFAARKSEIEFYGEEGILCDKTFYYPINTTQGGRMVFCGDSMVYYQNLAYDAYYYKGYQICSTPNREIVQLWEKHPSSTPEYYWGEWAGDFYLSMYSSSQWEDFFEGNVSFYRILSNDPENRWYADLPNGLVSDPSYLCSESSLYPNATITVLKDSFSQKTSYSIVGCDPSGTFGWVVGYIIVDRSQYYYVPITDVGESVKVYDSWKGFLLTNPGVAAVKRFLQQSERTVPQIQQEESLDKVLKTERIIGMVFLGCFVFLFFIAPVFLLLILFRKSLWRKIRSLFRRDADVPVEDTGFKPFQISLTKEELTQTLEDDNETETS